MQFMHPAMSFLSDSPSSVVGYSTPYRHSASKNPELATRMHDAATCSINPFGLTSFSMVQSALA